MSEIDPLPDPPAPSDSISVFNSKAFAFWGAMPTFQDQANSLRGEVNTWRGEAATSASTATTKAAEASDSADISNANANAAAAAGGASAWASGSYTTGAQARSTVNGRVYIARTTGSKPTDPSLDGTNWELARGGDLQLIRVTGASQTASVGGRYVLLNAAQSTLTAPASPQQGDTFAVKVANGRVDNLVNWNGAKHEGLSDATMTLDGAYQSITFAYIDATVGWGVI